LIIARSFACFFLKRYDRRKENIGSPLGGTQSFSEKYINQYIFVRVCQKE
jgi:hypothetical protein